MATDENDSGLETTDPFPTPPGFKTEAVGPLGIPIPVPDIEDPDVESAGGDEQPPAEDDGGDAGLGDTGGTDDLLEAADLGENYIDRVEAALDKETCGFCADILRQLRGRPLEEQVVGVRELAQLKQMMMDDAGKEDVEEIMDDFEVLNDPSEFL